MKWLAIAAAVIFIFLVGRWTAPDSPSQPAVSTQTNPTAMADSESDEECQTQTTKLRVAMAQIMASEYERYKKQRTLEDKVQVLERIVGRVFLAFLAHISNFQMSESDQALAKKLADRPLRLSQNRSRDGNQGYPEEPPERDLPSKVEVVDTASEEPVEEPNDRATEASTTAVEDSWQITPPAEDKLDEFLENNRYEDFLQTLRGSKFFDKNEQGLSSLQGTFSGKVTFDDRNKTPWDVAIELTAGEEEGGISGNYLIELSENGEAFSTRRGNGNIKEVFRKTPAGGVLLLEVSDSRYFQLYYIASQDRFVGNYYERVGPGDYQAQGKVRLTRN